MWLTEILDLQNLLKALVQVCELERHLCHSKIEKKLVNREKKDEVYMERETGKKSYRPGKRGISPPFQLSITDASSLWGPAVFLALELWHKAIFLF